MQAARALIANHLPWRMVTRKSIGQLPRLKMLVVSNVHCLSGEEVAAVRDWVQAGGTLYASGATSLVLNTGQRQPDFMLSEVFGVSLVKANWTDRKHYLSPTEAGRPDFPGWDAKVPAFVRGPTMDVRPLTGATVHGASCGRGHVVPSARSQPMRAEPGQFPARLAERSRGRH
jgi:hypothetical protein